MFQLYVVVCWLCVQSWFNVRVQCVQCCMYLVPGTQAVVLLYTCTASCLESKSIVTCDVMM